MKFGPITHNIIGCSYKVFNTLGFGFLENIYKKAMIIELSKMGLQVEVEKAMKVQYAGQIIGDFYIDLFVK